jgi:hypothetical protein
VRYAIFCARDDRSLLGLCERSIYDADPYATTEVLGNPEDLPLMVAKCKAWLGYLLEHEGSVVFLDDDVIVQRPLTMPCEADVILTSRSVSGLHPYNTGVIWANGQAALPFFDEVWKHVSEAPEDRRAWYGDQDAVQAVAETMAHAEVSCDLWNWTPEHFGQLRQELRERSKAVVHFKGQRKGWMKWYAREMSKVAA